MYSFGELTYLARDIQLYPARISLSELRFVWTHTDHVDNTHIVAKGIPYEEFLQVLVRLALLLYSKPAESRKLSSVSSLSGSPEAKVATFMTEFHLCDYVKIRQLLQTKAVERKSMLNTEMLPRRKQPLATTSPVAPGESAHATAAAASASQDTGSSAGGKLQPDAHYNLIGRTSHRALPTDAWGRFKHETPNRYQRPTHAAAYGVRQASTGGRDKPNETPAPQVQPLAGFSSFWEHVTHAPRYITEAEGVEGAASGQQRHRRPPPGKTVRIAGSEESACTEDSKRDEVVRGPRVGGGGGGRSTQSALRNGALSAQGRDNAPPARDTRLLPVTVHYTAAHSPARGRVSSDASAGSEGGLSLAAPLRSIELDPALPAPVPIRRARLSSEGGSVQSEVERRTTQVAGATARRSSAGNADSAAESTGRTKARELLAVRGDVPASEAERASVEEHSSALLRHMENMCEVAACPHWWRYPGNFMDMGTVQVRVLWLATARRAIG